MTAARIRQEYEGNLQGWTDLGHHLPWLYETAATLTEPVIIELGVRDGISTSALLCAAAETGGHVHSVDLERPRVPTWWWDLPSWTCHVGDDLAAQIMAQLPQAADLLFIDTSHHYRRTVDELAAYWPRVRPGGLLVAHDTELDMPPDWRGEPYPVSRALEDFCAGHGLAWENRPGDSGLGILRMPQSVV